MSIFSKRKNILFFFLTLIVISALAGGLAGWGVFKFKFENNTKKQPDASREQKKVIKKDEEESAVIKAVEKNSPAVVSIIIKKDLPAIESNDFFSDPFFREFFGIRPPKDSSSGGTKKREVGGGTGFIVSPDGYIVTNKHVVSDTEAEYTVLTNDQKRYTAKILARDSIMDVAILKIKGNNFSYAELGTSSDLKVGQTVIAIGNALGEFRNTVSTGVISGLSRSIVAGNSLGRPEKLSGVIQTDASINQGNSGGPLQDISGRVIGINTARASGAENIGFALPIDEIKDIVEDVKQEGRIIRPWLGVRYILLNKEVAEANNLEVDYGALILRGERRTDLAVIPGSPADKAGLKENDIILEVEGEKINSNNTLVEVINRYDPGEKLGLKILRQGEEKKVEVELGERDE